MGDLFFGGSFLPHLYFGYWYAVLSLNFRDIFNICLSMLGDSKAEL